MAALPPAVTDFIDRATTLDGTRYQAIEDAHLDSDEVAELYGTRGPLLSASESAALDTYVRGRLRPRGDELRTLAGVATISGAIATTMLAARLIWHRDRVAPEVFEIALAPFRDAGVDVS
ncbi:hypothetical protein [Occultella kanbiaonis]|uniref:hypothetical protein n=1 Tax=Occultella kanbiaonis TaxID=2675754 RepID=UPI0012B92CA3|nr:hypothetical protein [Occultella kanbiaonis]